MSTKTAEPTPDASKQDSLASKLLKVKSRPAAFVVRGKRATLTDELSSAYVTRGKRSQAASTSDPDFLVVVNGERMTGIPVAAVAHAIVDGVITREEVEALLHLAP